MNVQGLPCGYIDERENVGLHHRFLSLDGGVRVVRGWTDLSKNEILLRFVFHNKNTHYSHTHPHARIIYMWVCVRLRFSGFNLLFALSAAENFIAVDEKTAIIHLAHY